jgi:hypothetical protein
VGTSGSMIVGMAIYQRLGADSVCRVPDSGLN